MKTKMKSLGPWEEFCFLPSTTRLPAQLALDLERWDPKKDPGFEPVPEQTFAAAMALLYSQVDTLDRLYQNPYHNYQTHFASVMDRTHLLLEMRSYPKIIKQAMLVAALGHDIGHPGSTLRKNAKKPLQREELGTQVSNEWVSGCMVDNAIGIYGFSVGARLCIFSAIQATTFGDPTFRIPNHPLAHLIACADIAPSVGVLEWFEQGILVLEETPIKERPRDYPDWLEGRRKFVEFIKSRMTPNAWIAWGTNLNQIESAVKDLMNCANHGLNAILHKRVCRVLASK